MAAAHSCAGRGRFRVRANSERESLDAAAPGCSRRVSIVSLGIHQKRGRAPILAADSSDLLLSAAMIVRNEASHLPACLESISGFVDEIVIVDTGSTDDTVSIARSFGARVHVHPWTGNFAEPRNTSLELAQGKWILYIDADERLVPHALERARARIADASEVALRVRLKPFVGATPFWEYRLWRSDPRIRFAGVIHEKQTPAIAAVAAADGLGVGETELLLEHVGYEGDQTHKHERNLPLLRAQLAVDPSDTYNWHHLAVVLEGLGRDDEAEAALERAVEAARERHERPGMQAYTRLICVRRRRGEDTTGLLEEALARYPDNLGLIWLKVLAEIEAGRYEQALHRLELFNVDPEMPIEDIVGYRAELFGARAAEARGGCLFKLDRFSESAAAYAEAERLEPEEPAHRLKRALAESRAARQRSGELGTPGPTPAPAFLWVARELLSGLTLDIAGVAVELRATDAMRAAAMRALLGRIHPADRNPDVQLVFSPHPIDPPDRSPDDKVGWLSLWNDDDAFSITYGDAFGGRVEGGRATLGGQMGDLTTVFRYVAPFMLASLLAPAGRFLLHGGAISKDGGAVLVLGGTGAGKSTLAFGALEDGWTVLSDDLVIVSRGPHGPLVSGIPRPLVVPAEVLPGEAVGTARADDLRARVQLPFEAWDRRPRRITAIVIAGHAQTDDAVLAPIDRPDLLRTLIHSMLAQQPYNVRRYFHAAAALSDLPAWRLLHSRTTETRLPQCSRALRAIDSALMTCAHSHE
jgi:tetratricopeptide (TPR) repeat protein